MNPGDSPPKPKLCKHTGMERLPSGNGLTLTSCCCPAWTRAICEIENQVHCLKYEEGS